MTELHRIDTGPAVTEDIRRRAHTLLDEQAESSLLARVERQLARWIEPPLVAGFASGLVAWAVRLAVIATP